MESLSNYISECNQKSNISYWTYTDEFDGVKTQILAIPDRRLCNSTLEAMHAVYDAYFRKPSISQIVSCGVFGRILVNKSECPHYSSYLTNATQRYGNGELENCAGPLHNGISFASSFGCMQFNGDHYLTVQDNCQEHFYGTQNIIERCRNSSAPEYHDMQGAHTAVSCGLNGLVAVNDPNECKRIENGMNSLLSKNGYADKLLCSPGGVLQTIGKCPSVKNVLNELLSAHQKNPTACAQVKPVIEFKFLDDDDEIHGSGGSSGDDIVTTTGIEFAMNTTFISDLSLEDDSKASVSKSLVVTLAIFGSKI